MKTIMIGGKSYRVADEVAEEIERLRKSEKVVKFLLSHLSPKLARDLIEEATNE